MSKDRQFEHEVQSITDRIIKSKMEFKIDRDVFLKSLAHVQELLKKKYLTNTWKCYV